MIRDVLERGDASRTAVAVFDDSAVDVLNGGNGLDWYFAGAGDVIVHLAPGEQVN